MRKDITLPDDPGDVTSQLDDPSSPDTAQQEQRSGGAVTGVQTSAMLRHLGGQTADKELGKSAILQA